MNRQIRVRAAGIGILAVAVVVIGAAMATSLNMTPAVAEASASPSAAASASPAPTTSPSASIEVSADFDVTIDAGLEPAVSEVEGLEDGDPARPVGRLAEGDAVSDVVLDELIVSTETEAELDAFLARWNGEVLDAFPPADGVTDSLVRIDPSRADVSGVAANLGSFEAHDDIAVRDDATLRLLAILASETADHGTRAMLNPLEVGADVPSGMAQESSDQPNPFTWSYLRGGGTQDFAVGPAWQLLHAHGKLDRSVRILINDGGFTSHHKPVVTITKPTPGKVYYTDGGSVSVKLSGSATDQEDGVLSGTRFQWVATAGDKTVVLCTGSAFKAPTGNGGLAGPPKDCSNPTVHFGVAPGAPIDPTWTITLRVRDFASDIGQAIVTVDVIVQVG